MEGESLREQETMEEGWGHWGRGKDPAIGRDAWEGKGSLGKAKGASPSSSARRSAVVKLSKMAGVLT